MKQRLQSLTLPQKHLAAFLLGALMTLAMPPVGFFPVLFLCAPAFIWLTQSIEKKLQTFLNGWAFGAGYFIAGFYWISAALFVDIKLWIWVLPFSLIVGPGIYALYYGFIPLLARKWRHNDILYTLAFIPIWALAEYARGHCFTGFPWNLAGYAWDRALPMLQISSVIGIYGLTLLTLFWSAAWTLRKSRFATAVITATFAIVLIFGIFRLTQNPTEASEHTIRIVQPNIPQSQKWDPEEAWRNFEKILKLTSKQTEKPVTFVVFPETAISANLEAEQEVSFNLAVSLPAGSTGVLGNMRMTRNPLAYFNSVAVIDKKAKVIDTYDKHHLVPFGEYIPYRNILNITPVAQKLSGIGDFTPGPGPRTIKVGNLPSFSPLVCYEVIFPHEVANKEDRPEWLVNVTNDGWYGNSSGPYQHLAISRVRAIEEGLPLVRVANTGISAMIDPLGRITGKIALGAEGILDAPLPEYLPETTYSSYGDILFYIFLALFIPPLLRRKSP